MSSFSNLVWVTLLGAASLPAVSITSYDLSFNGTSIGGGAGNVSAPIPAGGGTEFYQIDGTLDVYDTATGLPVTGLPLTGGIALRFTNATISCHALNSSCMGTFLIFSALINFAPSAPAEWIGTFGLEGFQNQDAGLLALATSQALPPLEVSILSGAGNFSSSVAVPAYFTLATNSTSTLEFNMALQLQNGLPDNGTIILPNSLFLQLNNGAVPEPGTLAIVGAGLAGVIWFRRRMIS